MLSILVLTWAHGEPSSIRALSRAFRVHDPTQRQARLLTPSFAYKPFRYPWAYDFWKRQQQVHWMPEEVPLGEDCKDWRQAQRP